MNYVLINSRIAQLSYNTISIVKENLYNAFMNLPRHVRRYQDQEIVTSIRLVIGYICLLGNTMDVPHLNDFRELFRDDYFSPKFSSENCFSSPSVSWIWYLRCKESRRKVTENNQGKLLLLFTKQRFLMNLLWLRMTLKPSN